MSDIKTLTASLLQPSVNKANTPNKVDDAQNARATKPPPKSENTQGSREIRDQVTLSSGEILEKVASFQSLLENVESAKRVLDTAVDTVETILNKLEQGAGIAIQARNSFGGEDNAGQLKEFADRLMAVLNDIDNLSQNTGFAGENLLFGDDLEFQIGENPPARYEIQGFKIPSAANDIQDLELSSEAGAQQAANAISQVIDQVRAFKSQLTGDLREIEVRQEFSASTIEILVESVQQKVRATSLNDESAALLALQTRQLLEGSGESLVSEEQQNLLSQF